MKTLVIGAGVIGAVTGWQLYQAGCDVTLYVRPGKKAALDNSGIRIRCTDRRLTPAHEIETVFRPPFVESFRPGDGYRLIIVAVRSTQVDALLPILADNAGTADILFLTNNFRGEEMIRPYLHPERCLYGFSRVIGGWRSGNEVDCILFDQPGLVTMLGEADGQVSPRVEQIYRLFGQARLKPQISHDIMSWLATHYVEFLGAVGGILQAGTVEGFVANPALVERALLATREGLDVCRARGINLRRAAPINLRLFYLPLSVILPLARQQYGMPDIQRFFEENIAQGIEELGAQYREVVATGRRLGVRMPNLESFEQSYAEASGVSLAESFA